MRGVRFALVGLTLSLMAVPASAMPDLFGFSFGNTCDTFDGAGSFHSMDWLQTTGHVYRNLSPVGSAVFVPGMWNLGGTSEDFLISLTITNITASTADGSGSFLIKDTGGDTVTGHVVGTWTKAGSGGTFSGKLSNVTYASLDHTFDGHLGTSVSMAFSSPEPWNGSIIEMTVDGGWFRTGVPFDLKGGLVDATVKEAVPAPGALLLSLVGLSALRLTRRSLA